MKYAYLTIDIEEWYHLEYLKDLEQLDSSFEVVPCISAFLDMLDDLNIKATFFVIAELVHKNAGLIRDIAARGHALGCHGLDHVLLNEKTSTGFYEELTKARALIEQTAGCQADGYRAPCFSMERDKLDLLINAGFTYDSSKILFSQHPLYRNLDLKGFETVDDLVYKHDGFVEYEIPTISIGPFNIPISGGGYLRMLPFGLIKWLINKYSRKHENFLIYVHPFELTDVKLPLPSRIGWKDRFRVSVGRKHNLRKIQKVLLLLRQMGAEFRTLSQDRELRLQG